MKTGTNITPLTKAQSKLLCAADIIWNERADKKEVAYIARQLVQVTLPHKNPGNVPLWKRTNGNLTLALQPGINGQTGKTYGYPYGTIPRLLVFWMTTEALRTKSPHLELGHSLSGFMAELGLNSSNGGTGAKRSDASRLKNHMERLFRCRISFDNNLHVNGRTGYAWRDMQVAPRGMLWWDHKNPQQGTLWGSWIELGQDLYDAITSTPIPVDMRALRALKRSPLALDLYAWITYEAYRTHKNNQPRFVSWTLFHQQFGAEYTGEKASTNFQQAVRHALNKIHAVYPDLILGKRRGGIEVLPGSLPAISS